MPRLLGVEAAAEPVRLSGEIDLRAMDGELRLDAADLPVEIMETWLEVEAFGALRPARLEVPA